MSGASGGLAKSASRSHLSVEETDVDFVPGSGSIELSIVMPCLNEAETLGVCIEKAAAFLSRNGIAGEIVVGDNGSTDGSQSIAIAAGARVISVPVRGYGAALYFGCSAALGKYIVIGDSDDSYDFSRLEVFLSKLREGYDLVMGNRFAGGIRPGAMPWKNRYLGNPVLSGIGKAMFNAPLRDFHCGLRGFTKTAFETMDLRTTGMEFASEMVIKATLLRLRMTEVPTTLDPDGRSRPPHLRPWRDGWRHLRFMLLFCPNWLFLYPGLLLMAASLAAAARLLAGPLFIGAVRFDVGSLIYLAFFSVIGFQAVLFSLLSRVFAIQAGLYPSTPGLMAVLREITLERGLVFGLLLALTGFGLGFYSIFDWHLHSFGLMDINRLARLAIPSATGMTLGIQLVLFSFFFSTLHLTTSDLRPLSSTSERP
jgi:glycosyltransferase involved in cell wall biosynthesis